MKSLVLMMAVMSAPVWAQSQQLMNGSGCSPDYKVTHAACSVPSGETTSMTEKVVIREREPQVSKNPADVTRDYCAATTPEKQIWADKYKIPVDSIQLADGADNVDTRVPWMDGGTVRSYRKISCTFRAMVPIFVTKVADTCPVDHVEDANGCFAKDPVAVTSGTVNACLKMRPSSEAEFFIKSACLIDAYHAAQAQRLEMTVDQAKAIESALYFITKAAPSDHLNSYIQTEMSGK